MKIPRAPHSWSVSPRRAVEIQEGLGPQVRAVKPRRGLRWVVGVDAAFHSSSSHAGDPRCIAAAVVWDLRELCAVEERVAQRKLLFPYVPGLLSFREAPAVLAALRRLRSPVDGILCDGHGHAHPRRFGLACHVGVLTALPTIGCAKSVLVGTHEAVGLKRGSCVPLIHEGEVVGSVLRTRSGVRPVFVSIGHNVDLRTAEWVVLEAAARFRLPEPIRLADQLVTRVKRSGS